MTFPELPDDASAAAANNNNNNNNAAASTALALADGGSPNAIDDTTTTTASTPTATSKDAAVVSAKKSLLPDQDELSDQVEEQMKHLDTMLSKRNEELKMAAHFGTELLATIEAQASKLHHMESAFKQEQESFAVYKDERKKLVKENTRLKLITSEIESELNECKKDMNALKMQMESEREAARKSAAAAEMVNSAQISALKKSVEELNQESKSLIDANTRLSMSLKSERENSCALQKDAEARLAKLKELENTLAECRKREEARMKVDQLESSALFLELKEYAAKIEDITREYEALKGEHEEQNRLLSGLQAENEKLRTNFDANYYINQGTATEVVEKTPLPPYEMLPASVTLVTVVNLINAMSLIASVCAAFMHHTATNVPLFGIFLICISLLWLLFELRTNSMEEWMQSRIGFMYRPGGRGVAVSLMGFLVMSYGHLGMLIGVCTLINAVLNVFVLNQFPDLEKQYLYEATTFVELKEKAKEARERVYTKAKDVAIFDVESQRANLLL